MTVSESARQYSRVCPFCNKIHSVRSLYLNIICECGGKFYANTGEWWNRSTGEKVKGLKSKCGCDKCDQWKINKEETSSKCISFGFTKRILSNILECEESLTAAQKEAFNLVIDTITELDKE